MRTFFLLSFVATVAGHGILTAPAPRAGTTNAGGARFALLPSLAFAATPR